MDAVWLGGQAIRFEFSGHLLWVLLSLRLTYGWLLILRAFFFKTAYHRHAFKS